MCKNKVIIQLNSDNSVSVLTNYRTKKKNIVVVDDGRDETTVVVHDNGLILDVIYLF